MTYDPFSDAKAQINDGLGLRNQRMQPLNPPSAPQQPVQGQISPNTYSLPAGAPNPGQQFGAPPMGAPGQMQPMAGRFGGVSGGVSAPVGPGTLNLNAGMSPNLGLAQLGARYNVGPVSAGVQYQPGAGASGGVQYRQAFQKGGAVWTRKEGQNPEGGLNAAGRASLRAQGHDIKPPVSAKQAKKSPKAAARRSSFCARMSGMPGPMKDEKGRPTRKALSLRKWDC